MLNKIGLVVVGVLVIAVIMQYQYASHLKEMVAIERQAAENAQQRTQEARQQTLEVMDEWEAAEQRHRMAEADVKALQEEMAEQAESYGALRQRIQRAPASDDGPVSPVLRDALERLP
tara:strand:+ start:1735 stop:2088 length:354 start_codon:yes stop_codon:yes gene_type:complete